MDLVVGIVNWNTRNLLADCLQSVFRQTQGIQFKVCVVDNGSTDGSAEMVQKCFPQVSLIRNESNFGFAQANNQILGCQQGRYALLLNSDTRVIGNALKEMVDFMDTHPEAGAAGCQVLNEDGTLQKSCGRFPRLASIFFGGERCNQLFRSLFGARRFFAEYGLSAEDHRQIQQADFVKGCSIILRRKTLEKVGLLDPDIFMYFEEIDLCYRIKQEGNQVLYTPTAKIVHLGGGSCDCVPTTVFRNLDGQEFFFRKHYGQTQAILLRWTVAVGALLRLPLFLFGFLISTRPNRAAYRYKIFWNLYSLKWFFVGKCIGRPGMDIQPTGGAAKGSHQ